MQWDPTERDAWVADGQRWVEKVSGVRQCKIDLDAAGEVTGVHVIAGEGRDPRHIVRDVESLLKTRCGLDINYKKISVVQVMDGVPEESSVSPHPAPEASGVTFHPPGPMSDEEKSTPAPAVPLPPSTPTKDSPQPPEPPALDTEAPPIPAVLVAEGLAPRIMLGGVSVMATEMMMRAEIQLQAGEVEVLGNREGANHPGSDVDLVARATLDAVGQLILDPILLSLNEIRIRKLGDARVVLVAVDLTEGRRCDPLFGTCSAGHNTHQAVVYAILDALNRRLSLMSLRESQDPS